MFLNYHPADEKSVLSVEHLLAFASPLASIYKRYV